MTIKSMVVTMVNPLPVSVRYIRHLRTKERVREQKKSKERRKNKNKKKMSVKGLTNGITNPCPI